MDSQQPNWFVRTLVIIFLLLLATMVGLSFIKASPPYVISTASITVLLIITVLVLSEAFQNLSIGTLLSLSRRVEEKKVENSELKGENRELRNNIVKIATSVNQSQVTANVSGVPLDLLSRMLGVTPAKEQDVEEKAIEQDVEEQASEETAETTARPEVPFHRLMPYVEAEALSRYLEKYQLPEASVTRQVQFTPLFQGLDPIMERSVVFDGYVKTPQSELFLEVRIKDRFSGFMFDRLYVMLSKILRYTQAKHIQAKLILILVEFPENMATQRFGMRSFDRLIEAFQPAITNDLLKLETVSFTADDYTRFERLALQKPNERP